MTVQIDWILQVVLDASRHIQHILLALDVLEQEHKFIAAEA